MALRQLGGRQLSILRNFLSSSGRSVGRFQRDSSGVVAETRFSSKPAWRPLQLPKQSANRRCRAGREVSLARHRRLRRRLDVR